MPSSGHPRLPGSSHSLRGEGIGPVQGPSSHWTIKTPVAFQSMARFAGDCTRPACATALFQFRCRQTTRFTNPNLLCPGSTDHLPREQHFPWRVWVIRCGTAPPLAVEQNKTDIHPGGREARRFTANRQITNWPPTGSRPLGYAINSGNHRFRANQSAAFTAAQLKPTQHKWRAAKLTLAPLSNP